MKEEINHEARWIDLFENQRVTLEEATYMVLYRQQNPREILADAIDEVKNRPFHELFALACALREVIKAAMVRNDRFVKQDFEQRAAIALQQWHSGPLPLEALPWAERAVYFLHEVLHYARRDTALLLGMSDSEVSLLARAAKKRMGLPEDPLKSEFCRRTPVVNSIRVQHSIAFAAYE